jgi:hypothetical protein
MRGWADREFVEIVIMPRVPLWDFGFSVRLLMQNGGLLPECPFGSDGEHLAVRVLKELGQDIKCIGPDDPYCGGHPRRKWADFQTDFGANIGFGECRTIPDIDSVRVILVHSGSQSDFFLPEKFVQLRAKCLDDPGGRQTVHFLVETIPSGF